MSRASRPRAVAIVVASFAALLLPPAARAHGTLVPATGVAGTSQRFELIVPNDRADADIVGVKLTLPAGMRVESAEARQPQWAATSGGSTITWQGGPVARGSMDSFAFTASLPSRAGRTEATLVERYDDGAGAPFPLVITVTGGVAGGGASSTLAAIALAVACLALVVASVSLAVVLRRRSPSGH